MLSRVHFSSASPHWSTPETLFDALCLEFNFDFDPCPKEPTFDGLTVPWGRSNFVNPPYGRAIGKWLKRGYEEYLKGRTIVFLVPSRTDTQWWHEYCMKATEIRFIRGRLHFNNHKNAAPFPSAIVIFKPYSYEWSTYPKKT